MSTPQNPTPARARCAERDCAALLAVDRGHLVPLLAGDGGALVEACGGAVAELVAAQRAGRANAVVRPCPALVLCRTAAGVGGLGQTHRAARAQVARRTLAR